MTAALATLLWSVNASLATVAKEPLENNDVTPGVLGFVVVALLGLATYLLIKSMTKQMRRIELPDQTADERPAAKPTRPTKPTKPTEPTDGQ